MHDAVDQVTGLVEETQKSVGDKVVRAVETVTPVGDLARTVEDVRQSTAGLTFDAIRATNHAVRSLARFALPVDGEAPHDETPMPRVDLVEATVNAVMGDQLAARKNPLGLTMSLRHEGRILPATPEAIAAAHPSPSDDVVVFVHGLGCTEREFAYRAAEFYGEEGMTLGTLLERELGVTPLYVRYNSGLHISDNGRALAALLETLTQAYPRPLRRLTIVGHSMGGLVARSAVHYGVEEGATFVSKLAHVVSIGSPHLGAPLEQASHVLSSVLRAFDVPGTQIPAKLLDGRSAGIKDLRYGYIREEDWRGKDANAYRDDDRSTTPFAPGVRYHSIAACVSPDPEHPLGELLGDLMVRTRSARGQADASERCIPFEAHDVIAGVDHLALVNHPKVLEALRGILRAPSTSDEA